jgi:hypothetical protein
MDTDKLFFIPSRARNLDPVLNTEDTEIAEPDENEAFFVRFVSLWLMPDEISDDERRSAVNQIRF